MLKTLFQRLFQRQSVDAILASFTSTIKRLETAAKQHAADAATHAEAEAAALARKVEARFESARAYNAALRIRALVDGGVDSLPEQPTEKQPAS